MRLNKQLSDLLQGRAVVSIEEANTTVVITFQDSLVMRLNAETKGGPEITKLAKVTHVLEEGINMEIGFQEEEKLFLRVVNPGHAVSVRDEANQELYLG